MSGDGIFEVRCPDCGTDPNVGPPCRVCGGRCCACYHDDDPTPEERP